MALSEKSTEKLLCWIAAEDASSNESQLLLAFDFLEQYMSDHGFLLDIPKIRQLIMSHSKFHDMTQADIDMVVDNRLQLFIDILEMNKLARISAFHMLNMPID